MVLCGRPTAVADKDLHPQGQNVRYLLLVLSLNILLFVLKFA